MAGRGDTVCGAPEEVSPGVTLSDSLIVTRMRCRGPLPTPSIRLDRENISCIGELRRLEGIHSLYLQQNKIQKIENLESFPNLRFLCLARNRIQRVENLQSLPQLSALDLSRNLIQVLDTEELPRSLRILDLTGNECTWQEGYRDQVLGALPQLLQLDSQPIRANAARKEAGRASSSSEEEEEEEEDAGLLLPVLSSSFTVDQGASWGRGHSGHAQGIPGIPILLSVVSSPADFFADVHRELAGRAQRRRRRRKSLEEHQARLLELLERRAVLQRPGQDTARRCQPCPQGTRLSPLPPSCGSQRAPGAIQPPGKGLEKETRAKGAGNG
ncbi:leucine-rich repeat-containing protein 46 [Sylvia atricapilla]|uniref:leucine-rich repeat-containing protein 46 n=1 Tax=Sylvia atricapilla TaxID=48155 RepID=UPI003397BE37